MFSVWRGSLARRRYRSLRALLMDAVKLLHPLGSTHPLTRALALSPLWRGDTTTAETDVIREEDTAADIDYYLSLSSPSSSSSSSSTSISTAAAVGSSLTEVLQSSQLDSLPIAIISTLRMLKARAEQIQTIYK